MSERKNEYFMKNTLHKKKPASAESIARMATMARMFRASSPIPAV